MNKTRTYIGIDPGINGAISLVENDHLIVCTSFPTFKEMSEKGRNMSRIDILKLAKIFRDLSELCINPVILVESPLLMPGQNVSSTFNNGKSHGILVALLTIFFMKVKINYVKSREWQEEMIQDRTFVKSKIRRHRRKQLKLDSIKAAQFLFPKADFTKSLKSKVISDGKTDSALIAVYCSKMFSGE